MSPSDDRDETPRRAGSTATGTSCSRSSGSPRPASSCLSGFLLTLPFTQVFAGLDPAQQWLYLALVLVASVAVGLNLTPIMLHRRVFGDHVKERVVEVGHLVSQAVIVGVALLVVGTAALIFSVVVSWTVGFVVGAAPARPGHAAARRTPAARAPLTSSYDGAQGAARGRQSHR